MVGKRRSKCPWAKGGPPTNLPKQLLPTQVTSDYEGGGGSFRMCKWERGVSDPSPRDLAGPGDLDCGGASLPIKSRGSRTPTPLKKAHAKNCLPPSARYVRVGCCMLLV
jgi:hypothetical protein